MFSQSVILLAALAGSAVAAPISGSASALPASVTAPADWASGYLEDYQVYHARYLAIGCDHNAEEQNEYFKTCCQPILANQTFAEVRPEWCAPKDEPLAWAQGVVATQTVVDAPAASEFVAAASSVAEGVANITATATEYLTAVTYAAGGQNATLSVLSAPAAATTTAEAKAAASSSVEAVAAVQVESSSSAEASSTYEAPSSTSTWEEPSSTYVAPTSTWVAPTSTYEAPAETTAAAPSNNGGDHYGQATFFYQNGNPGSCGNYNSDSTPLVALPAQYWNYNGGSSPSSHCGGYIQVFRGDRSVTAVIADLCPSCVGDDSIDLSVGAFNAIASADEGSVAVTWKFI